MTIQNQFKRIYDLAGTEIGSLRVMDYVKGGKWRCVCSCGRTKTVLTYALRHREHVACRHPESRPPGHTAERSAFCNARKRCQQPTHGDYHNYGERGIEFRFSSFEEFLAEIGPRPTDQHTLDRENNNGHYEPGNVRWATRTEQANNTRANRPLVIDGVSKGSRVWAIEAGIPRRTIETRLFRGYCNRCAVFAPRRSSCPHRQNFKQGPRGRCGDATLRALPLVPNTVKEQHEAL